MRLRHKPWAKDKLQQHSDIVIGNPENHKGAWNDVFGRRAPLFVEIGTGKGQFITGMANKYPDVNFLGIELSESVIVAALQSVLNEQVENVRLINGNAIHLESFFSESEVGGIYLNFSDPWPKNRHEKRRLTYESFLALYKHALIPNGEVYFKTDNQGLFEYSLHSFSKYGMILDDISLDLHNSEFENNVMTEYEEKFSEKGNRIYRCKARFRG